jgi:arylsulfatase A-like enzyme
MLAAMVAGAAGCARADLWYVGEATPPAARPNIVLIVADDLGWGDVGFNGQRTIATPQLDRLAAAGLVMEQFYSGAPVCAPSRAVLVTGRHAGRVSVQGNELPNTPLDPDEPSMAAVLRAGGYRTALLGKWGLGGAWPEPPFGGTGELIPEHAHSLPTNRGYDQFFGYLDQGTAHEYYPETLWRGTIKEPIAGNFGVPKAERTTYVEDLLTAEAIDFLATADGTAPLFLHLSYILPHRETIPPPGPNPYADRDWPEIEKAFAAMVTHLDGQVGRVAAAIESNPALRGNTVLLFTSDNGPQATDGHSPLFFQSSGGLRGAKRDLYEGGIRVPLLVHWPGRVPAGARDTTTVGDFADMMPTLAAIAGLPNPPGGDGRDLSPAWRGTAAVPQREAMLWLHKEAGGGPGEQPARLALRQGSWKLILKADGSRELYDLATDPAEQHNRAGEELERLAAMETRARSEVQRPAPWLTW